MHTTTRARQRPRHGVAQRREPSAHALQQRPQVTQLAHDVAFGSLAQTLGVAIAFPLLQAVDEQARMLDHALALRMLRALVVQEPAAQLARG